MKVSTLIVANPKVLNLESRGGVMATLCFFSSLLLLCILTGLCCKNSLKVTITIFLYVNNTKTVICHCIDKHGHIYFPSLQYQETTLWACQNSSIHYSILTSSLNWRDEGQNGVVFKIFSLTSVWKIQWCLYKEQKQHTQIWSINHTCMWHNKCFIYYSLQ